MDMTGTVHIKLFGTKDHPLPDNWRTTNGEFLEHSSSRLCPHIVKMYDLLIYHAIGHMKEIALVQVTGTPEKHDDLGLWPWLLPVKPLAVIPFIHAAPSIHQFYVPDGRKLAKYLHNNPYLTLTSVEAEPFLAYFRKIGS